MWRSRTQLKQFANGDHQFACALRTIWLAILLLFCTQSLFALNPQATITGYNSQNWYSDEGLPHNTVQSIAQTADGYLWFATWAGLSRYNANAVA